MTNITDEGLMFEAQKLTGSDCVCEDLKLLTPNDPICHLHKTFSVLQQVRDAAKKEERERCAKVVEGKEMVGEGYGVLHLGGWNQAIKVAVTAIRQME